MIAQSKQTVQTVPPASLGNHAQASATSVYSQVVERYASLIEHPVARLRFLNGTLAKQAKIETQLRESLQRYRFLERVGLYERLVEAHLFRAILVESAAIPPPYRQQLQQIEIPFSARLLLFIQQYRHLLHGLGLVAAALLLFGLYSVVMWSGQRVTTYFAQKYGKGATTVFVTAAGQASDTPPVTDLLNRYEPEKVWLVKSDSNVESYSNGGRILRDSETDNHPRAYYRYPRTGEAEDNQIFHEPIGIIYHTSENEIDQFVADNNDSIQRKSQNALRYIRDRRSYHYLIDRYGEIHRVVRDDQAANHAGFSMWSDEQHTYIGLNESFIGVCFESTSSGDTVVETLTEAQVLAGRQLTNILRAKYKIADANCTTHGLVSVNPEKTPGLVAFHHDWARNFPFEAMGLSDKYKVPTPNIALYGFTWDEEILAKLENTLWPGAFLAEEEFKQRAQKARVTAEALRERLRLRWKDQYQRQKALQGNVGTKSPLADAAERSR